VLNAFRHHGVSRPIPLRLSPASLDCAQRLSASRSFAECRVIDDPANEVVLNAFRHHGVSRVTISNLTAGGVACSTPFGITEFRGLTYLEMTHA